MATNKNPIFLNTVSSTNVAINNADGSASFQVFVAGADGGALTNLSATTTDTSDVIVEIISTLGATTNVLGEVVVPAGSGTDGFSPSKNLLDFAALDGVLQNDGSLLVGPNGTILVAAKAAVTAATILSVSAVGGSYSA